MAIMRAYCSHCRHRQTFNRVEVRHWFHFILTVVTLGFWGVSWIAITIASRLRPWRCEHCGWHKPEFLSHSHPRNMPSSSAGSTPEAEAVTGDAATPQSSSGDRAYRA